jgi:hypothetical protein
MSYVPPWWQRLSPRDWPFRLLALLVVAVVLLGTVLVAVRSGLDEGTSSPLDITTTSVASTKGYLISGSISADIAKLADNRPLQLGIGGRTAEIAVRDFLVGAETETTGLATVTAGNDLVGFDAVPKSDLLDDFEVQISFESTASSLVLLRPELSEIYTIGDPVWDAGVKMMIAEMSAFPALVAALKSEAASEGTTYLREIGAQTEIIILDVVASLREEFAPSNSDGPGETRARRYLNDSQFTLGSDTLRPAAETYGYSCDEGLLPLSGAEADGLCFEVVTPPRERWETHDFADEIEVRVSNKSPRIALLYYQTESSAEPTLVGLVPPFTVPSPSVVGIISKLYSTAAQLDANPNRYRLKDASSLAALDTDEDAEVFRLPGGTEAGRLSAVTVLGAQDAALDLLLEARQFDFGRAASAVLTLLSSYLFPAMGVVLDNRRLNFRSPANLKRAQLFAECSISTVPNLIGEFIVEDIYGDGGIRWDKFLTSEGAVPKVFWFVYLRLVLQDRSCDSALEKAELLTICMPSLQAVANIETYSTQVEGCINSNELFNALVEAGIKRALVNIVVSPFEKIDVVLAAGSLSATALLSLGDFLRFGNGDVYPLNTLRVPRWCYEVGQSRLRLLGPQRSTSNAAADVQTLIRNLRERIERYAPYATPEFWQRESIAWERISTLDAPSFVPDPSALKRDATTISAKFATIASWFPDTSIYGRATGLLKAISPSGRQEITELQDAVAKVEIAWRPCPNSGN